MSRSDGFMIQEFVTACFSGNINEAKRLFRADFNIEAEYLGSTSLIGAAQNGHASVVKFLLSNNANHKAKSSAGAHALKLAAQEGKYNVVKAFCEYPQKIAEVINMKTEKGVTALCAAAESGHNRTLKLLLKHGADIQIVTNEGLTSLMYAVYNRNAESAKILLEHAELPCLNEFSDPQKKRIISEFTTAVAKQRKSAGAWELNLLQAIDRLVFSDHKSTLYDLCSDVFSPPGSRLRTDWSELSGQLKCLNRAARNWVFKNLDKHIEGFNEAVEALAACNKEHGQKLLLEFLKYHSRDDKKSGPEGFSDLEAVYALCASAYPYNTSPPAEASAQQTGHRTQEATGAAMASRGAASAAQVPGQQPSENQAVILSRFLVRMENMYDFKALYKHLCMMDFSPGKATTINIQSILFELRAQVSRPLLERAPLSFDKHDFVSDINRRFLMGACLAEKTDIIKKLLSGIINVESEKDTLFGEIYRALKSDKASVVECLIECGVSIDHKDSRGRALLHNACSLQDVKMVQSLIKKGADVNMEYDDQTPLYKAITKGNIQIINLLLESENIDVNKVSSYVYVTTGEHPTADHYTSISPLFAAVLHKNQYLVERLLSMADARGQRLVNIDLAGQGENKGFTPLHQAINLDLVGIAKVLVDAKADLTCEDKYGRVPLVYACVRGQREISAYLLGVNTTQFTGDNCVGAIMSSISEMFSMSDGEINVSDLSEFLYQLLRFIHSEVTYDFKYDKPKSEVFFALATLYKGTDQDALSRLSETLSHLYRGPRERVLTYYSKHKNVDHPTISELITRDKKGQKAMIALLDENKGELSSSKKHFGQTARKLSSMKRSKKIVPLRYALLRQKKQAGGSLEDALKPTKTAAAEDAAPAEAPPAKGPD